MTDDIEQIKMSLQKIESALLGDQYHPDGVMQRVENLEKKQKNTDIKIAIGTGFWMGLSFLFTKIFK